MFKKKLFTKFKKNISPCLIKEIIKHLLKTDGYNSFSFFQKTANYCLSVMKEYGLQEIRLINLPADGKTKYGDWVMPKAWDVLTAELKIITPSQKAITLAKYEKTPHCVIMYSSTFEAENIELIDLDKLSDFSKIKDKIVLTSLSPNKIIDIVNKYHASGIITDYLEDDKKKSSAIKWYNDIFGPWSRKSGTGFSISKNTAKILRENFKKGPVKISFKIKTRFYNGNIPIITGIIPGQNKKEEILLFGHLFEPGANDNASGIALILEIMRIFNFFFFKKGKPLKKTIRCFFSFEQWGTLAYFFLQKNKPHKVIAGLNLDMVGEDLKKCKSTLRFRPTHYFLPSFSDFLLTKILDWVKKEEMQFNWLNKGPLLDNLFLADPLINIPCPALLCWPDKYYHTSLDTLDKVDSSTLTLIGSIVGCYLYFLSNCTLKEVNWLAKEILKNGKQEFKMAIEIGLCNKQPVDINFKKTLDIIKENTKKKLIATTKLAKLDELPLAKEFEDYCQNKYRFISFNLKKLTPQEVKARKIIYKRKIWSLPSLQTLPFYAKKEFEKITDSIFPFSSTLASLIYYLNGKNSVLDIFYKIKQEDKNIKLEFIFSVYQFLEKYHYIKKV